MNRFIRRIYKKHKTNCPFTLAELLRITIWFRDLGNETRGFFQRRLRRNYIVIHQELSYEEARYTVAHELGHYFFDRGTSYFRLERNTLQVPQKYEVRANRFAVSLLTHTETIEHGEPLCWFLSRCGVPQEMHRFYEC